MLLLVLIPTTPQGQAIDELNLMSISLLRESQQKVQERAATYVRGGQPQRSSEKRVKTLREIRSCSEDIVANLQRHETRVSQRIACEGRASCRSSTYYGEVKAQNKACPIRTLELERKGKVSFNAGECSRPKRRNNKHMDVRRLLCRTTFDKLVRRSPR